MLILTFIFPGLADWVHPQTANLQAWLNKKKQNLPRKKPQKKKIYPEEIFPLLLNSSNHRINTTIMRVTIVEVVAKISEIKFYSILKSIESCLVVHLLFSLPYNYNIFWLNIAIFGYILKKRRGLQRSWATPPFSYDAALRKSRHDCWQKEQHQKSTTKEIL